MSDESCVLVADLTFEVHTNHTVIPEALLGIRIRFAIVMGRLQYWIQDAASPKIIEKCETLPDLKQLQQSGRNVLELYLEKMYRGTRIAILNVTRLD